MPQNEIQVRRNRDDRPANGGEDPRGNGFIAALDQSGGSTPKALAGYGVDDGAWGSDEEMFALIHQMRTRIITSPCFASGKVIGAILFERTMDGEIDGKPVPQALMDRGVVPFIKIDKGLEDEDNGVQMMKPMPGLDALLERAKGLGVFGTKERSVINRPTSRASPSLVAQQFQVAQASARARADADHRARGEHQEPRPRAVRRLLLDRDPRGARRAARGRSRSCSSCRSLRRPACSGRWSTIPRCFGWSRLSGGFSRAEACAELARNPGMIASFSRALLSDLRARQSDEEFDRTLGARDRRDPRGVDAQGAGLTLDEDEFDPDRLSRRPSGRSRAKLYLVSPQDVGGAFPTG